MPQGDDREITEREATINVTGLNLVVYVREYQADIEIALKNINGKKFYSESVDYRSFSREQFLRGEMERFVDWDKTDQERIREMAFLPAPPIGFCYQYDFNRHRVECVKMHEENRTVHERTSRALRTISNRHNYVYGKGEKLPREHLH